MTCQVVNALRFGDTFLSMSLDTCVETLIQCTEQLGCGSDAVGTFDEGFYLLHRLTSGGGLCQAVAEKLTGFGQLLTGARDADKEVKALVQTRVSTHLKELPNLKGRLEETSCQELVVEIKKLGETLELLDAKREDSEKVLTRLESWTRSINMICEKHRRAKSTAGGLFLASGCLALTLSAATLLIRCAVQKSGGALSPAANVIFRFSPWNTTLAGGIVTVLGFSDACHSNRYSKLTFDFRDLADDVQKEVAASRSFRTRIQRMRHALSDLDLALHVTVGVQTIDPPVWSLLIDWIPALADALNQLDRCGASVS